MLVGLLALAEGRSDDREMLREADREDVLHAIEPEMLDRIAYRLYAEDEEHLSAYERLLKDDKRKKMDYLNNIRPDLVDHQPRHSEAPEDHNRPASHHDLDHHTINDIPKPDPTKESIRDQVLRESKRRQNDMMEEKRHLEEQEKSEKERMTREEEAK